MTAEDSKPRRVLWTTLSMMLFMLAYTALMLACLLQWGTTKLWSRINLFTGSAILISLLMGAEQLAFSEGLPPSPKSNAKPSG